MEKAMTSRAWFPSSSSHLVCSGLILFINFLKPGLGLPCTPPRKSAHISLGAMGKLEKGQIPPNLNPPLKAQYLLYHWRVLDCIIPKCWSCSKCAFESLIRTRIELLAGIRLWVPIVARSRWCGAPGPYPSWMEVARGLIHPMDQLCTILLGCGAKTLNTTAV